MEQEALMSKNNQKDDNFLVCGLISQKYGKLSHNWGKRILNVLLKLCMIYYFNIMLYWANTYYVPLKAYTPRCISVLIVINNCEGGYVIVMV